MIALLLVASLARASSCCLPTTTAFPLALGPDERWGAGLSVAGVERVGGWAWDGRLLGDEAYDRRQIDVTVAALARVTGPLQVGVGVPFGVEAVRSAELAQVAIGPGDLALQAVLLPEARSVSSSVSVPSLRPYGGVELRVPTAPAVAARSLAAVGSPSASVGASAALELGHVGGVAVLGGSARRELGVGAWSGSVALTEAWRLLPAVDLTATSALSLGDGWFRPDVGIGAIVRASARVRATARVDVSPAVAGLGRSADAEVRASAAVIVTGAARVPTSP